MRFIVLGLGAVGGTVAAALSLAGEEVVGIARGAHLEAIRAGGLTFRSHAGTQVARFDCAGAPGEVAFREGDVILLAVKSQDSAGALDALRAAGVEEQAVYCLQNGVHNEHLALRRFPNVHACCVMLPAQFLTPGEVAAFGRPNHAMFDIGRFPGGHDATDEAVAAAMRPAGLAAFVQEDAMASKYGKLVMNMGNVVQAALGKDAETKAISDALRAEARAVLAAAGIAVRDVGLSDPRREELMSFAALEGVDYAGSSSLQSLAREAGSIETDYLNGEIVYLARLHGVPAPKNAWFARLAARLASGRLPPGSVSRDEVAAAIGV